MCVSVIDDTVLLPSAEANAATRQQAGKGRKTWGSLKRGDAMEAAVVGALVAAFVTALGWLANHYLTMQREARQADAARLEETRIQRLLASIRHVEAQLSQLYGPMMFCLQENDRAFSELLVELGRQYVFDPAGDISDADLTLWLFWSDNVFLPNHAVICELLRTKAHLIEGPDIPDSYRRFLEYYYSWKVYHERWKLTGTAYRWHARDNWPVEFSIDVQQAFRTLKARHASFLLELDDLHASRAAPSSHRATSSATPA